MIDYRNPDYHAIFKRRLEVLAKLRADPAAVARFKRHYQSDPAAFISDWGITYDPRNVELGRPAIVPFILFPRQEELISWIVDSWRNGRPGVMPKSRDVGATYVAMALSITLCLFNRDMAIGFGSRKVELVDKGGDPKTIFHKGRQFLDVLPREFRGGYTAKHSPFLRITIPETESTIVGEGGDNIGRGGRTGITFVDESAHVEHPESLDAALSANCNCAIHLSSVCGTDNPFARKCMTWPEDRVFRFHWRDDPRKDDAWYESKKTDLDNPMIIAQEYDIDFNASKEGVLIPSAWVNACIGAARKLGIDGVGVKIGALDVADEGKDKNAFAGRDGINLRLLESWSGVGDDIFGTTQRAFDLSRELGLPGFRYDADGLGAGVRGDARVINERDANMIVLDVEPFWGSGGVIEPERQVIKADGKSNGRTNDDYFANRKAQGWWALRTRCQVTFRAVTLGMEYDPDEIISFDETLPELQKLTMELSQPTFTINGAGKILVDKAPDGMKSPNNADAVMIVYAPNKTSRSFFE